LLNEETNPIDTAEYFVRQQYVDVLGREPDEAGFNYWSDRLLSCGANAECLRTKRQDIAVAFFHEQEMQLTGSYVYDLYSAAVGRRPTFAEYTGDHQQIMASRNLNVTKDTLAERLVSGPDFMQKYPANLSPEAFVRALVENVRLSSSVDFSSKHDELVSLYASGAGQNQSRGRVLRAVADNGAFKEANYNSAFVLTEYFGYLRRDPDPGGYEFWIRILNSEVPTNYRGMVCSFITAVEYQRRFGSVVSASNSVCGR
jgi:hypothetical protein